MIRLVQLRCPASLIGHRATTSACRWSWRDANLRKPATIARAEALLMKLTSGILSPMGVTMKRWQVGLLLLCGVACGDDSAEQGGDAGLLGRDGSAQSDSVLGASPTQYSESMEAANSAKKTPEATGYTLETENGIAIHGSFEASNPTADSYRFNSGALGTAGSPGFPGVNVLLVIDGVRTHLNTPLSLSLDTVVEHGYSSLTAGNYFNNASLIKGDDYVITVQPGTAGKSYVLELRGKTP